MPEKSEENAGAGPARISAKPTPPPPSICVQGSDPKPPRCQGDLEAKRRDHFLTLLGSWWAAGGVHRITEAEGRGGWTGAPEPARRHIRPPGPGGVAGAQHAALAPSPASTHSASLRASERCTSSSGGFAGSRGRDEAGSSETRNRDLVPAPPGTAAVGDLQVPLLGGLFPDPLGGGGCSLQGHLNSPLALLWGRRVSFIEETIQVRSPWGGDSPKDVGRPLGRGFQLDPEATSCLRVPILPPAARARRISAALNSLQSLLSVPRTGGSKVLSVPSPQAPPLTQGDHQPRPTSLRPHLLSPPPPWPFHAW